MGDRPPVATGDRDNRVMVSLAEPDTPGGIPTVIFGLPAPARDFLADGKRTHSFDLSTAAGIPCRVLMFGADTYEGCAEILRNSAASFTDDPTAAHRDIGFGGDDGQVSTPLSDLFFNMDHEPAKMHRPEGGKQVFDGFNPETLAENARTTLAWLKQLGVPGLPEPRTLVEDFLARV